MVAFQTRGGACRLCRFVFPAAALLLVRCLLAGCSEPGGTAVLEFGENDPLKGGMRPMLDTLRASIQDRFGGFGELGIESMAPEEIPYESQTNTGTTFYKHRYRMRLTFEDDLDEGQRQAIRTIFDDLHHARANWPRAITVGEHSSQTALGDRGASLIYTKQYRYGIKMPSGNYPTHCTVRLKFEPPLPVDFDTFAAAAKQHAIDFEYAPLQQAFTSDRFEVIKSHGDGFGSSPELHHVRLGFGVIGDAIDMGPGRGGWASAGSQDECNKRVAETGRPFAFDIGWTFDRVVEAELDFAESG